MRQSGNQALCLDQLFSDSLANIAKSIHEEEYLLVLYINNRMCETCVERELERLSKNIHMIGESNVIILTEYYNSRLSEVTVASIIENIRIIDCKIYNDFSESSKPCMFLIDRNLKINKFLCCRDLFESTYDEYYEIIENNYFNN